MNCLGFGLPKEDKKEANQFKVLARKGVDLICRSRFLPSSIFAMFCWERNLPHWMHFFDTACNQYLLPLLLLWVVVVAVASLSILVESRHNLIYNLQKEQGIQSLFTILKTKIFKVYKTPPPYQGEKLSFGYL